MYFKKFFAIRNDGAEKIGKELDETIHVPADETEDDVKIYIRPISREIIKDFYVQ